MGPIGRQGIRSGSGALNLIAVVALAAACGATVQPLPPVASSSSGPSLATGSVDPAESAPDPGDGGQFELPTPGCPSPPGPVIVPDVRVSIGDGPAVIATRGATTFSTCTTTSATDVVGEAPSMWLTATHEDRIRLQVQAGWRIVRVEGYDSPAVGDGANVDEPIDLPAGPDRVDVAVPVRAGDTRAGWTLWLVRVDGKVVGQLDVAVHIHLPAAGG